MQELYNLLPTNNTELKTVTESHSEIGADGQVITYDTQSSYVVYDLQYIFSWVLVLILISVVVKAVSGFVNNLLRIF